MERSVLVRWLGGVVVVGLLVLAWRQQQLADNQGEILRQIQELRASSDARARQAPVQQTAPTAAGPDLTLRVEGSATRGDANARLVLIEFSDFECPFCGRYVRESWPQLDRDYVRTGKVRYVFRHFPVSRSHPHATKAAEAGECARRQGKFWPLHDRLFANQQSLAPPSLLEHARAVGLNMKAFETCLNLDEQAAATVREDFEAGASAAITGTPAFFFGFAQKDGSVHIVERFVGAKPYATFQAVLDKLIALPDAR